MGVGGAGFGDIHVDFDAEAWGVVAEGVSVCKSGLDGEEVGEVSARFAGHLLDADVGGRHAKGDAGRGGYGSERVMWGEVDVMGLGPVGDF